MSAFSVTVSRTARTSVLLAIVAVAVTACVEVRDASDERARQKRDSIGNTVYIGEARPGAPTPSPDALGPDSATPVRGHGPVPIEEALRADTAMTLTVVDSSPAAAPTDADLALLRRELIVPVAGLQASALRDTYGEMRGGTRRHEALDIPAARGTPVVSAAPGHVLKLFTSAAGGLMVYAADSTARFILMYAHLDAYQPGLAEGQLLRRGQPIGVVGTTGNAPRNVPHLHFAIARSSDVKTWWKGSPVNPYPLLR